MSDELCCSRGPLVTKWKNMGHRRGPKKNEYSLIKYVGKSEFQKMAFLSLLCLSLCCVSLCCVSLPLRLHLSYLRVLLHDPFHAHFSSGCVLDGHLYMHVAFLSLRSPRSDYDFSSFCSALCLPRCWITSSLTHCLFLWSSFDLLHRPCPRAWQLLPPSTCFWITPDSLRLRDPLFFRSPIRCFYLFLLACLLGCLFAASSQHSTYR